MTFARKYPAYMTRETARQLLALSRWRRTRCAVERDLRAVLRLVGVRNA